jgi:hypothetical protein
MLLEKAHGGNRSSIIGRGEFSLSRVVLQDCYARTKKLPRGVGVEGFCFVFSEEVKQTSIATMDIMDSKKRGRGAVNSMSSSSKKT